MEPLSSHSHQLLSQNNFPQLILPGFEKQGLQRYLSMRKCMILCIPPGVILIAPVDKPKQETFVCEPKTTLTGDVGWVIVTANGAVEQPFPSVTITE